MLEALVRLGTAGAHRGRLCAIFFLPHRTPLKHNGALFSLLTVAKKIELVLRKIWTWRNS
jgi:hypothetical protein